MMNRNYLLFTVSISALVACSEGSEPTVQGQKEPVVATEDVMPEGPVIAPEGALLKVYKAPASVGFNDATINMELLGTPSDSMFHFHFNVNNYALGEQTADAEDRGCANSAKGQHIHYIMNNAPYKAYYESDFEEAVPEGTNVLLAFLSRSYHESIKAPEAAVVANVVVGDSSMGPGIDIENDPILFYSRPKGTYKISDGEKILLDFYMKNVALSNTGYKVRATINDEVWVLTDWDAYFIEGLGVGTHTVRLELIDSTNTRVPGAFNDSGDREFTITAD
jgi:hypothetical protein